jgi:hypothetical protein
MLSRRRFLKVFGAGTRAWLLPFASPPLARAEARVSWPRAW